MDVRLEVVEGLRLGTIVSVAGPRFLIGRDEKCQLRPKSPAVSAVHCAIVIEGNQVRVQDMGSTNGTLVNDRCLRQGEVVRVKDGDRLQVAQLSFMFRIAAAPAANGNATVQNDSDIVDWLSSPDAGPPANDPGRTTLLRALEPSPGPTAASAEKGRTPASGLESSTLFAFRTVDPLTKATSFGLSPLQLMTPAETRALRHALLEWADRSPTAVPRRLILDLSAVESLPSSIYALLLALSGRCQHHGGEVRLCSASAEVRQRLTVLHLADSISCYEDRARAVTDPWE